MAVPRWWGNSEEATHAIPSRAGGRRSQLEPDRSVHRDVTGPSKERPDDTVREEAPRTEDPGPGQEAVGYVVESRAPPRPGSASLRSDTDRQEGD